MKKVKLSPRAKRIVRICLWSLAGVFGFLLLALITLPLWIGPVVKGVANSKVPAMTQTGFDLGEFGFNPFTGRAHAGGIALENPARFFTSDDPAADRARYAVTLGSADVDLAMTSLLSSEIRIDSVDLRELKVYAADDLSNFNEIAENVAKSQEPKKDDGDGKACSLGRFTLEDAEVVWGDLSQVNVGKVELDMDAGAFAITDIGVRNPTRFYADGKTETNFVTVASVTVSYDPESLSGDVVHIKEIVVKDLHLYGDLTFSNIREIVGGATALGRKPESDAPAEEPAPAEEDARRFVIDRIAFEGMKIRWGVLPVSLWTIELTDIGADEPIDEGHVVDSVIEAICKAAEKAQVGLGRAIRVAIEAGNALGAAVTVAVDKATKMAAQTTEAATKMAAQTTEAAKATFESGTKALGDAAGSAVDAIKGFVPGFGK